MMLPERHERINMPDGAREQKSTSGGSPAKSQWAAWQAEMRAAAAEDRERVLKALVEEDRRIQQEYRNPVAFWLGLLAVMVLCVAGWFIVNAMRCDMFYSTVTLAQRPACR